MIQNTLPSHRAFVVPHHSSKTTVLASTLLVAQAHGRLPVSAENLYAGLVLGAIFLRLLTTYLIKVKQKIKSQTNFNPGLGPIPRDGKPHLWRSVWSTKGRRGKEG